MDGDDGLMRLQLVFAHCLTGLTGDETEVVAQPRQVEEVVLVEEDVVYLCALGELVGVGTG